MQALLDLLRPKAPQLAGEEQGVALVVGLGNPGREYADTRHNVGFQVVGRLAQQHGLSFSRLHMNALVSSGRLAGARVVLAKPQTWMNDSGRAVAALARFYKVDPLRLLVIYDDLDLALGVIRLRPAGGSGGHKGLKSIIEKLGTQDFARLRIGIGRPPGKMDPVDYVLQPFGREQLDVIQDACGRAVEAVELFLQAGLEAAMNAFNRDKVEM